MAAPSSCTSETLAQFSTLPPELRRKIWDATFTPRTLSIITDYSCTSTDPQRPVSNFPFVRSNPFHGACVTFTVAEGLHPQLSATPFWAELPFRRTLQALGKDFPALGKDYGDFGLAVPKVPVAFHVCRESRAVAMERYELAFAGKNYLTDNAEFTSMFEAGGLDQKRVWVDFKRDEIFVVHEDDTMIDMRDKSGSPFYLELLGRYAPEETAKIERLAVAGFWTLNPNRYPRSHGLREGWTLPLKAFERLRRLRVYARDADKMDEAVSVYEDYEEDEAQATVLEPMVRRDPEEVRQEILGWLRERKGQDEKWTQDLPEVEVSWEIQWYWEDVEWRLRFQKAASGACSSAG